MIKRLVRPSQAPQKPTLKPPVSKPVIKPPAFSKPPPTVLKPKKLTTPLPRPKEPEKLGRKAVPTLWQRQLAGLQLMHPVGQGQQRLDAVCEENGWTWGIIEAFDKNGEACVAVLVGTVILGSAEHSDSDMNGTKAWNEFDQALGSVAELLEDEHGNAG